MTDESTVQLNYVIPEELKDLLSRYCEQNMVSPSALIRRLVREYVEGDRTIDYWDHPRGRRTTVALPGRLLDNFENTVTDRDHGTKAAVIAALLSGFLPNRVFSDETVKVELDLPTDIFNKVYQQFGPGPIENVIQTALQAIVNSSDVNKETSNARVG